MIFQQKDKDLSCLLILIWMQLIYQEEMSKAFGELLGSYLLDPWWIQWVDQYHYLMNLFKCYCSVITLSCTEHLKPSFKFIIFYHQTSVLTQLSLHCFICTLASFKCKIPMYCSRTKQAWKCSHWITHTDVTFKTHYPSKDGKIHNCNIYLWKTLLQLINCWKKKYIPFYFSNFWNKIGWRLMVVCIGQKQVEPTRAIIEAPRPVDASHVTSSFYQTNMTLDKH